MKSFKLLDLVKIDSIKMKSSCSVIKCNFFREM